MDEKRFIRRLSVRHLCEYSGEPTAEDGRPVTGQPQLAMTLGGIACFGVGVIPYAWALRTIALHNAQIIVSMQYALTILLAAYVLGELITPAKWIGIALIAVGLFVCTR